MNNTRKLRSSYSKEQKLKTVKMVPNDKLKVSQVSKMLGIDRQTIHTWLAEYEEVGEKAFIDKSILTHDALFKQQEKKLKEMQEENEILKKALAYFAELNKKG